MFGATLRSIFIVFAVGVLCSQSTASAGQLSRVRSAVRKDKDSRDESRHDSSDSSHSSGSLSNVRSEVREEKKKSRRRRRRHHHRDYGGSVYLHPVFAVDVNRVDDWRPPTIVPAPDTEPPFPEADTFVPNETPFQEIPAMADDFFDGDGNMATVRFLVEHGFKTDNVDRWGFGLLWLNENVLGLQTEWNFYSEELASGRRDDIQVGDFNLLLRLFETESVQGRVGIGIAWLDDAFATDFGINFTAGLDISPIKPLVVSAEVDWGTIGDADVFHGRVTAGARWKFLEAFAGYDYRRFGSVSLHGPTAGIQLWF